MLDDDNVELIRGEDIMLKENSWIVEGELVSNEITADMIEKITEDILQVLGKYPVTGSGKTFLNIFKKEKQ